MNHPGLIFPPVINRPRPTQRHNFVDAWILDGHFNSGKLRIANLFACLDSSVPQCSTEKLFARHLFCANKKFFFSAGGWSVLRNSVAVRSEDFWVLARLRRRRRFEKTL